MIKLSVVLNKCNTLSNYNINVSIDSVNNTSNSKSLEVQEVIIQAFQDIRTEESGFLAIPDVNDNTNEVR